MKAKLFRITLSGCLFLVFAPFFVQPESASLMNSIRLSERILIVGTGEMKMDMVAAVNTRKGIVIIDTGISPSLTKNHRGVIEKTFGPKDFVYVINTHAHGDHTNGNQVFKEAVIVAHENAAREIRQWGREDIAADVRRTRKLNAVRNRLIETFDKNSLRYRTFRDRIYVCGKMADDFETIYRVTPPALTFTDHLTLDMGDMTIELLHFSPDFHTDGDILVSIPEEHTVFTGDIIFPNDPYQTVTARSDIGSWILCLDRVFEKNTEIKHVVAYHIGILSPAAIHGFYHTLKAMGREQREKKSAVERLKTLISVFGVRKGIGKFRDRFVKNKDDGFYIWEGDLLSLAGEYRNSGKYHDALMVLKMYEEIFPRSTRPLYFQGDIYTKLGKKNLAVNAYRKMLQIDPDNYYYARLIFQLNKED